jgi:hypothetical protein
MAAMKPKPLSGETPDVESPTIGDAVAPSVTRFCQGVRHAVAFQILIDPLGTESAGRTTSNFDLDVSPPSGPG